MNNGLPIVSSDNTSKPIIFCDVQDTLIFLYGAHKCNQPLIDAINAAEQEGFDVRIVSSGLRPEEIIADLREHAVSESILTKGITSKESLIHSTPANVAAIIDDRHSDHYIRDWPEPRPPLFRPKEVEKLNAYLAELERGAGDQEASGELSGAQPPAVALKEPDIGVITETMRRVLQQVGKHSDMKLVHSVADWEAADFNLKDDELAPAMSDVAQTMDKMFERLCDEHQQEGGLPAAYIRFEEDCLRLDSDGTERKWDRNYTDRCRDYAAMVDLDSNLAREKVLGLTVIAFTALRAELGKQGYELPHNPVLDQATELMRSRVARDTRPGTEMLPEGQRLLGGGKESGWSKGKVDGTSATSSE